MNTNEIVKALRICNNPKGHRCSECPAFSQYEHRYCKSTIDKQAANLIEAQDAKIERLQKELDAAVADIHEADRFRGHCFRCKSWNGTRCKRGYSVNASFCNDWQWRGAERSE